MCYPSPGPRCHTHATANLSTAKTRLETAYKAEKNSTRKSSKERLRKALENFRTRQSDYDTTNAGLMELAKEYTAAKGTSEEDAYSRRLYYAKLKRKQQGEWLKEFNRLKKEKASTSPTLSQIESSIEMTTHKISEEGRMFDPALLKTKKKVEQAEAPAPRQKETKQVRVEAPDKSEIASLITRHDESDLPAEKSAPIRVESFDALTSKKPLIRKSGPRAMGSVSELRDVKKHARSRVNMSASASVTPLHTARSERKFYEGKSLRNAYGDVVADRVISTPQGAMWIVDKGGYNTRIRASRSPQRDAFYQQFGLKEAVAA